MRLIYDLTNEAFICDSSYEERDVPKQAGFTWERIVSKRWATRDPKVAEKLRQYATPAVLNILSGRKPEGCSLENLTAYCQEVMRDVPAPKPLDWPTDGHYTLRPYQEEAVEAVLRFYKSPVSYNGIEVLSTGSGKSLVIAFAAKELRGPCLVFQPTKEILDQNYSKLLSYGAEPTIWSASMNRKELSDLTLATIGSVTRKADLFSHFKYILVDECHVISAQGGMYHDFIKTVAGARVCGFTATPYRLHTNSFGSELRFLTRTRPRIFREVIYYVQTGTLFEAGYLCPIRYVPVGGFSREYLQANSTGAEYSDESVKRYFKQIAFPDRLVHAVRQLAQIRRNVLVFTRFIEESEYLVKHVPGSAIVTGETPKREREEILRAFKAGELKVVSNVGVLTHGFDFPALETVVLARPTMSLALYYQMIGRAIRPHRDKRAALVVDLADNLSLFGPVERLTLRDLGRGKWIVLGATGQLTNTPITRGD